MPLLQGGAISGRCGYQKLHHAGKYWCRWRDSNPQNSLSENEMSTMKLHHIGVSGTPDRTRTCIFHPLPYLLVRSEGGYWGKNWISFLLSNKIFIAEQIHNICWLGIQDSNLEPAVPKTVALPIELIPKISFDRPHLSRRQNDSAILAPWIYPVKNRTFLV